jgi:hypothetical protein
MFVQVQMNQIVISFNVHIQILQDVVPHSHYQIVQHLKIKCHVIKLMAMVTYAFIMIKINVNNIQCYHNVQIIQVLEHFVEFNVIIMKQARLVQQDHVLILFQRIHVSYNWI